MFWDILIKCWWISRFLERIWVICKIILKMLVLFGSVVPLLKAPPKGAILNIPNMCLIMLSMETGNWQHQSPKESVSWAEFKVLVGINQTERGGLVLVKGSKTWKIDTRMVVWVSNVMLTKFRLDYIGKVKSSSIFKHKEWKLSSNWHHPTFADEPMGTKEVQWLASY